MKKMFSIAMWGVTLCLLSTIMTSCTDKESPALQSKSSQGPDAALQNEAPYSTVLIARYDPSDNRYYFATDQRTLDEIFAINLKKVSGLMNYNFVVTGYALSKEYINEFKTVRHYLSASIQDGAVVRWYLTENASNTMVDLYLSERLEGCVGAPCNSCGLFSGGGGCDCNGSGPGGIPGFCNHFLQVISNPVH